MIEGIKLENFKCFSEISIGLSNLNVFSGINGVGKSTTIQSLLLLKQSMQQGYIPNSVALNGEFVNLGTGRDLLYEHSENEKVVISLFEDEKQYSASVGYSSGADVLGLEVYDDGISKLLACDFEYLNAERSAPQSIYPKSSYYVDSKSQLGIHGQYTVHYLSKYQDEESAWYNVEGSETSLKEAVQYWLNMISPNVKISAEEIENTDLTRLGYYYTDNDEKSNVFRPTNVGFGISYTLPVIVALLKATPGSILIIENPEAHLHPSGQRKVGELIARCAANNIQIFLETHSDHVLNGIRIAVKNKLLSPDKVRLHFFKKIKRSDKYVHTIETPELDQKGKMNYWPDGFFDEWDKALDEII